ncbi:MAG: hypothetical protein AABN34_15720 [Acidobacteriota bacterium]
MLRYDLDKLAWWDFESLIQTLLKERLGIGIEAWGGNKSDLGRDAYYPGSLSFPTDAPTEGPFLFQCKFVEGANAAGADPTPALVRAMRAECSRIAERNWEENPTVYALFTNVVLTPKNRQQIEKLIRTVLPGATICSQGGTDVCALLDCTPQIVRRFPQLMGLRDFTDLLRETVNADILNRSKAALSLARDVAEVFVPTQAYHRAFSTLRKHDFVVLDGPPEMGKTAIGRMIALVQVLSGWEAVECRGPEDVLRAYRHDTKQVFIADDFFGRNEYEPERVSLWERELPHILTMRNSEHWLIVTSRAHLLRIGSEDLDLGSFDRVFPSLGEILVDASDLSTVEKAQMLYRHAKAANLPEKVRSFIRGGAEDVVSNPYFTPERIRRLMEEYIVGELRAMIDEAPNTAGEGVRSRARALAEKLTAKRILGAAIDRNLKDPTKGMTKTFGQLQDDHRWMLFAFVESETLRRNQTVEDVVNRYNTLCPSASSRPPETLLQHLTGAFINQLDVGLSWVHPSCRDLVIEQFRSNDTLRRQYLSRCKLEGLQLATSIGGGPSGKTHLPLLVDDNDWAALKARAIQLVVAGEDVLSVLVNNYRAMRLPSADAGHVRERFGQFFDEILKAVRERAATGIEWSLKGITTFYMARELSESYCPTVDPSELFGKLASSVQRLLAKESVEVISVSEIGEFRDFLNLMSRCDPSFLRTPANKATLFEIASGIVEIVEPQYRDLTSDVSFDEDIESEMADLSALIDTIDAVEVEVAPWRPRSKLREARELLSTRFDNLEDTLMLLERARDEASESNESERADENTIDDDYRWSHPASEYKPTVEDIFRDL